MSGPEDIVHRLKEGAMHDVERKAERKHGYESDAAHLEIQEHPLHYGRQVAEWDRDASHRNMENAMKEHVRKEHVRKTGESLKHLGAGQPYKPTGSK